MPRATLNYFVFRDSDTSDRRFLGNDKRFRGGIIEQSVVRFHYFLLGFGMGPGSGAGTTVL